jgi:hypothetical protein
MDTEYSTETSKSANGDWPEGKQLSTGSSSKLQGESSSASIPTTVRMLKHIASSVNRLHSGKISELLVPGR